MAGEGGVRLRISEFSGPRLDWAPQLPGAWRCRYGIGSILQVARRQALLIANRRIIGESVIDFEDGADGFVFDDLAGLNPAGCLPLARNEKAVHPRTGRELIMVAYLANGGFIPLDAQLPDGTPHPAAGAGFALATYRGRPAVPATAAERRPPGGDVHCFHELIQLRFDGRRLQVVDRLRFPPSGLLDGYCIVNRPINNAVSDGADLLSGLVAVPQIATGAGSINSEISPGARTLARNFGCGLCRWRYTAAGWRPGEYTPVSGPDRSFEPSLVRDADGGLLMSVRGVNFSGDSGLACEGADTRHHFRLYRSDDNGHTWSSVMHLPNMRSSGPVVLNQFADGQPCLLANPFAVQGRRVLGLWPLTGDRRNVKEMIAFLDGNRHFGPPRPFEPSQPARDNEWWLDHPVGNVVRLGDNRLHALICFRVTDAVAHMTSAEPAGPAGLWVEEIGPARN